MTKQEFMLKSECLMDQARMFDYWEPLRKMMHEVAEIFPEEVKQKKVNQPPGASLKWPVQ